MRSVGSADGGFRGFWCFLPAIAALLLVTTPDAASADMPSSANYRLDQYAFTGGPGNLAAPPASAEYRLGACSVGGIADDPIAGASAVIDPGYLVPWVGWTGVPEIIAIWRADGRLYIAWRPVPLATGYRVESAADLFTAFVEDLSGVYAGETWNCPVPRAASLFYRVGVRR